MYFTLATIKILNTFAKVFKIQVQNTIHVFKSILNTSPTSVNAPTSVSGLARTVCLLLISVQ